MITHGTDLTSRFIELKIFIPGILVFHLDQLLAATNNFSPQNRIGRGGFGMVYKVADNMLFTRNMHKGLTWIHFFHGLMDAYTYDDSMRTLQLLDVQSLRR